MLRSSVGSFRASLLTGHGDRGIAEIIMRTIHAGGFGAFPQSCLRQMAQGENLLAAHIDGLPLHKGTAKRPQNAMVQGSREPSAKRHLPERTWGVEAKQWHGQRLEDGRRFSGWYDGVVPKQR